jgi:hypothetical protein
MMEERINNNEQKPKKPRANRILIIVSIFVGVLLGILIDQVPFIARIFDQQLKNIVHLQTLHFVVSIFSCKI